MKHCPNERCSFRLKHGHAAEYEDEPTQCADCGAKLADGGVPEASHAPAPTPPALVRRLAVSLAAVAIAYALTWLRLPTVDAELLQRGLHFGIRENVSVAALGLNPLVSAAILVELVALIVPSWRALRVRGAQGRAKLWRASVVLTFIVAVFQAFGISMFLANLSPQTGGIAFHGLTVLTLVAGTALLLLIAHAVERWGLGNGLSLLLAGAFLPDILRTLDVTRQRINDESIAPMTLVICAAAMLAMAFATVRAMRGSASTPAPSIRVPASGAAPVWDAHALVMLPATFAGMGVIAFESLPQPGSALHTIGLLAAALLLTPVACWLFNQPQRVARVHRTLGFEGTVPEAKALLRRAMLRSAIWVAVIVLGSTVVLQVFGGDVAIGGALVIVVTSVVLDLLAEFRFRKQHEQVVLIWEEHRVYAADAALTILQGAGIPTLLRGVHHRTLLQFFGPYVAMHVCVPESRETEARALLAGLAEG